MPYFLLLLLGTFAVFAIVIAGMAVGVMFGRKSISGSCGGLGNKTDEHGNSSCSLCSNPGEACRELARRAAANRAKTEEQEVEA
jgi:thiamine biosynthesis lipoprotein